MYRRVSDLLIGMYCLFCISLKVNIAVRTSLGETVPVHRYVLSSMAERL